MSRDAFAQPFGAGMRLIAPGIVLANRRGGKVAIRSPRQAMFRTNASGEQKANLLHFFAVDEGRKRVLLIAASILAARKLADWDGRPSPASESAIANAIATASLFDWPFGIA
jgi:hypothetical protein